MKYESIDQMYETVRDHKIIYDGIKLLIKPYCHKCSKFDPKVFSSIEVLNNNTIVKRVVACELSDHCSKIESFIKENN